ncbi:MAG: hypothetical protein ACK47B_23740 [Armatimonadota bacterium]
MGLDFRIAEAAQLFRPPATPFAGPGGGAAPAGAGNLPLTGWDPYSQSSQTNFAWDVEGAGWDEGAWYGQWEGLTLRLAGGLELRAGAGPASFTRPSTTTRTNRSGASESVAADAPAYDWLTGARGGEHWCYRADQADALLAVPAERNLTRSQGALTLWIRPAWCGWVPEAVDRIFLQSGGWKLWKPAGSTALCWQVPLVGGGTATVERDISGLIADQWFLLGASWSRAADEISLRVDDLETATAATAQRFGEFGSTLGIGQGTAAGAPAGCHVADVRAWPAPLTDELFDTLYLIGTGGELMAEVTAVGITKQAEAVPAIVPAAYAAGDVIGGKLSLADVVRADAGTGILQGIVLTDKADQKAAVDIAFFDADPTGSTLTDNQPVSVVAADIGKLLGVVSIQASDYVDLGPTAVAVKAAIALPFKLSAARILYAVVIARGTPTYASASDLKLRVQVLQD